jgi:hypothetical protein
VKHDKPIFAEAAKKKAQMNMKSTRKGYSRENYEKPVLCTEKAYKKEKLNIFHADNLYKNNLKFSSDE